jgi:hypothetical protein
MTERFIYCNIAQQEEEYFSKVHQEHVINMEEYKNKVDKENGNFGLGAGGVGANFIFFIIFLVVGIIFLKKKQEVVEEKKGKGKKSKKSKEKTTPKSNMNKPIGIGLIVLGVLCFLSIGGTVYILIQAINNKKNLKEPETPSEYDYKRPCYSRTRKEIVGRVPGDGSEDINADESPEDNSIFNGIKMPRLPKAAQQMLVNSQQQNQNTGSQNTDASGSNAFNFTGMPGLAVSSSNISNNQVKGGTYNATSNDTVGGWERSNQSSGEATTSDGTPEGTFTKDY